MRLPLLLAAALFALPAEARSPRSDDSVAAPKVDRAARDAAASQDPLTQMTFWAREHMLFPDDLEAARAFAEALRRGGRPDRAAEVASAALRRHPDDPVLTAALGHALLRSGRAAEALAPLARAAAQAPGDWRAQTTFAAALDMAGRHAEAMVAHEAALKLAPDEAAAHTNIGVSFLLTRQPAKAEAALRRALSVPGATVQARQNLALAVALQGRFDEAREIATLDLGPQAAAANMDHLRRLLGDQRRWGDIGAGS
jgi:Flp pilus assembly protein TadD